MNTSVPKVRESSDGMKRILPIKYRKEPKAENAKFNPFSAL